VKIKKKDKKSKFNIKKYFKNKIIRKIKKKGILKTMNMKNINSKEILKYPFLSHKIKTKNLLKDTSCTK
jgi:hypothetical protein